MIRVGLYGGSIARKCMMVECSSAFQKHLQMVEVECTQKSFKLISMSVGIFNFSNYLSVININSIKVKMAKDHFREQISFRISLSIKNWIVDMCRRTFNVSASGRCVHCSLPRCFTQGQRCLKTVIKIKDDLFKLRVRWILQSAGHDLLLCGGWCQCCCWLSWNLSPFLNQRTLTFSLFIPSKSDVKDSARIIEELPFNNILLKMRERVI